MKKMLFLALTLALVLGAMPVVAGAQGPDTKNYDDITLTGGSQAGHFPEWWDLTAGDLVLSFTYDANGLVDNETFQWQDHAWAELGVRSPCDGDFNPTFCNEGSGGWLATDYDEWQTLNTFDPDPSGSPTLDLDDKLILQKAGGHGEGDYNLPSAPPNPGANHRFWFDRDGVDQWRAQNPLAVDGGTYNTGGTYEIIITLHATSDTSGEAHMTINGLDQGFETDGNWNTMELTPAGMTFTGDMEHLQVFYGLYGYGPVGVTHSVVFEDITVDGHFATTTPPPCAREPSLERSIDIKPGSDPNSINLKKKKGLVAVAILGSTSFDVTTVNVESLTFEGAQPAHDLTDPDVYAEHLEDVNADGEMDLVVHFKTQDLTLDESSTKAYLDGMTYDGLFIWGTDTVNIVKGK